MNIHTGQWDDELLVCFWRATCCGFLKFALE